MLNMIVTTDSNDGDYNTAIIPITEQKIEEFRPIILAISKFRPYKTKLESDLEWEHKHNFPEGECCREDLGEKSAHEMYKDTSGGDVLDDFTNMLPKTEFGLHTIVSIEIVEIKVIEKLI